MKLTGEKLFYITAALIFSICRFIRSDTPGARGENNREDGDN